MGSAWAQHGHGQFTALLGKPRFSIMVCISHTRVVMYKLLDIALNIHALQILEAKPCCAHMLNLASKDPNFRRFKHLLTQISAPKVPYIEISKNTNWLR